MKIWIALSTASWSSVAWACPSCPVGRAAREQVCQDDFMLRLIAVVLPFIVMGAVSVCVERVWSARARGNV